jgi:hypothetical protein
MSGTRQSVNDPRAIHAARMGLSDHKTSPSQVAFEKSRRPRPDVVVQVPRFAVVQ